MRVVVGLPTFMDELSLQELFWSRPDLFGYLAILPPLTPPGSYELHWRNHSPLGSFGVGGHLQVPNPLYMPLLPEFLGPKSLRRSPLTLRGRDMYYPVPPLLLQPNSNSWKWRRQHLSLSDPREGESTWDVGPASPALFSEVASQYQARQ